MGIEINKVFNARIYIDGFDFIAKAEEVDLPKVQFKFVDAKGLGLYSEFQLPSGLEKMEAKIKFNSLYPEFIGLASDPFTVRYVIVRGSNQHWTQQGVSQELPIRAEMRGIFKEFEQGNLKIAEAPTPEATLSVMYYKLQVDYQDVLEIDVINNIYRVNGVDILQNYRINIGG